MVGNIVLSRFPGGMFISRHSFPGGYEQAVAALERRRAMIDDRPPTPMSQAVRHGTD
jgi:hypothetical protein